MNNPRDFLPERYRHYLENKSSLVEKKSANKLAGLLMLAFLVVGILSSYILSKQNQDNRQQASSNPYELAKTSKVTNSCDSGWYVCNVGCCGVGGTPTEGKRYSLIVDSIQCPNGSGSNCVDGHITWYYDDDLSKRPEIQSAIATELEARGLAVDSSGGIIKIVSPAPVSETTISPSISSSVSPTPKITASPTAIERPETKGTCDGQGSWFSGTCYLYWEVLPGGTHVVAPPNTIDNYSYATFQSIEEAEDYFGVVENNTKTLATEEVADPTGLTSPSPTSTVAKVQYESGSFFNQLDDRWKNIQIENGAKFGNVGCGVVSVSNLTGVSPEEVLSLYPFGSPMGITSNGTGIEANESALKKLGYKTSAGINGDGVLEDEIRKANANNDYSEVVKNLNDYQENGDWQIMLNGNFGNLDGGGHWVVVKDVNTTNNTVTVIDPNGGELTEYVLDVSGNSGNEDAITPKKLLLAKAV